MIAVCFSFLLSIHVWILLLYIDLITAGSLIVLLYSSNMILILTALGRELFPSVERSFKDEVINEIAHDLNAAAYTLSPREFKDVWPNLYIKRWKTKNLDKPVEYPLDRNAYLTAKYIPSAVNYSCFLLKNSHLKQLVMKSNLESHGQLLDEPHPRKMVNDCFDVYIDRRSVFYKMRNVIGGGLKQFTRPGEEIRFRNIGEQELTESQYTAPYSSDFDLKVQPSYDHISASKADRDAGVLKLCRRISRCISR